MAKDPERFDPQERARDTWQRAQAWSEWEKLGSGDIAESTRDDLNGDFERALARRARTPRYPPA